MVNVAGDEKSDERRREPQSMPVVGVVGMFPPPVNGMALVTSAIAQLLEKKCSVFTIDCSPGVYAVRSAAVRVRKFGKQLRNFAIFARWSLGNPSATVYVALSGGFGQLYDIFFVGCARLGRRGIFLHHHGYQYVDRRSSIAALLFLIAGKKATHIVACEEMAVQLSRRYAAVCRTRYLSGAIALCEWGDPIRDRQHVRTIGYLSNISHEKGIVEFVRLAEICLTQYPSLNFLLAGQFQDADSATLVEEGLRGCRNLKYVGPVYKDEKRNFLDEIDVLIFPTHVELEGLVIHEAHSRGVPVIARRRGCIPQIIASDLAIDSESMEDYVGQALNLLVRWMESNFDYLMISAEVKANFDRHLRDTRGVGMAIVEEMVVLSVKRLGIDVQRSS